MRILVVNGPNLNMLGTREPQIYGRETLGDLEHLMRSYCAGRPVTFTFFQSNHEGAIIDAIQAAYESQDAIIINPAAYTHTSIAILDALKAVALPTVEVHLSDISGREPFRRQSYISAACLQTIQGKHFQGYLDAVDLVINAVTSPAAL